MRVPYSRSGRFAARHPEQTSPIVDACRKSRRINSDAAGMDAARAAGARWRGLGVVRIRQARLRSGIEAPLAAVGWPRRLGRALPHLPGRSGMDGSTRRTHGRCIRPTSRFVSNCRPFMHARRRLGRHWTQLCMRWCSHYDSQRRGDPSSAETSSKRSDSIDSRRAPVSIMYAPLQNWPRS